jgi:uncharacterized protein (DUF2141 family)
MFVSKKNLTVLTAALALTLVTNASWAVDITVKVVGINSAQGQIGCSLFEKSPAFPLDNSNARQLWLPANINGAVCKFEGVAAGLYAVSIGHDLNGNKRVDTNFLGVPKEGWGVSNNVVPTLRPPRFDEAQFQAKDGANLELEIKLVY